MVFQNAKWIWAHSNPKVYNETIAIHRPLNIKSGIKKASIAITADSWYRLFVNGEWVADGPARYWPEHTTYDVIDISGYLYPASPNHITILARHYGIGDFHGVYQRPGVLFELNIQETNGRRQQLVSDKSCWASVEMARQSNTSKISIQMEPAELYDARLEGHGKYAPAVEIADARSGPWKNLTPRDTALLTQRNVPFQRFVGGNVVKGEGDVFCVAAARLCQKGYVRSNIYVSAACGMASALELKKAATITIETVGWNVAIDGKLVLEDKLFNKKTIRLKAGKHFVLALAHRAACWHFPDKLFSMQTDTPRRWFNPLKASADNPWVFLKFDQFQFDKTDLHWPYSPTPEPQVAQTEKAYKAFAENLIKTVITPADLASKCKPYVKLLKKDAMFVQSIDWQFRHRQPTGQKPRLENPAACLSDNAEYTTVYPTTSGDVELIYDIGQETLGYWLFDLLAPAGVIVDAFAVEYITPNGKPQFPFNNQNGLRYITAEGRNQFLSIKPRAGRYLFLTLRNLTAPVKIRHIGLIETTYPTQNKAEFDCSDPTLTRIWQISERTVELCMTDTYVDCPLYEQTLWVGDARNETLFGYVLYGAEDIARRCIRLAAESLRHYPLVGCQVPTSWDCLLPAWSFLWTMSVWDYYWQTADRSFVRQYWQAVQKNVNNSLKYLDDRGLFTAPMWNMFDWSGIDQDQDCVLHNSMLLVGALNAAIACAELIGKNNQAKLWKTARANLKKAINRLWDAKKGAYPDSIHVDGTISPKSSVHSSFLSVLYDIADDKIRRQALKNTITPPKDMVRVGSPFAIFYQYLCWEKVGYWKEIFDSIYQNYKPMLAAGATTVWETFPEHNLSEEITAGGPTRSHCHAWSSAPVYFIARLILGVQQTAPGGKAFLISPYLYNLSWAKGTVKTHQGDIKVVWRLENKTLYIDFLAPNGVSVKYARNFSHKGLTIVINGKLIR